MISINGIPIIPTIFPDGTSQVWKLNDKLIKYVQQNDEVTVTWNFNNEAELIHLAQLKTLLNQLCSYDSVIDKHTSINLHIPFLPYSRQDKEISNTSTFALDTFANLINGLEFDKVSTIDPHNIQKTKELFINMEVIETNKFLPDLKEYNICYPDKGAYLRYGKLNDKDLILAYKNRNPLTGNIDNVIISNLTNIQENQNTKVNIEGKKILIVDDICDGGMTFILVAKELLKYNPSQVDLYVTHGIFSKGIKVIYDSGITNIYTKEGLVNAKESTFMYRCL